jgi:hypothetical protein
MASVHTEWVTVMEPEEFPSAELERLYSTLSESDRDQLLQELLVARAQGG